MVTKIEIFTTKNKMVKMANFLAKCKAIALGFCLKIDGTKIDIFSAKNRMVKKGQFLGKK